MIPITARCRRGRARHQSGVRNRSPGSLDATRFAAVWCHRVSADDGGTSHPEEHVEARLRLWATHSRVEPFAHWRVVVGITARSCSRLGRRDGGSERRKQWIEQYLDDCLDRTRAHFALPGPTILTN